MKGARAKRWIIAGAAIAGGALLWTAGTAPTGFSPSELIVFAAPGAVLAIAGSWAAHAFRPTTWRWRTAAWTGAAGAIVLPPVIAFSINFFSAMSGGAVVVTFVLGAWVVLIVGVLAAVVIGIGRDPRVRHLIRKRRPARRHRRVDRPTRDRRHQAADSRA